MQSNTSQVRHIGWSVVLCLIFLGCIMIRCWPLAIFLVGMVMLILFVRRRPGSLLAQMLYVRFGPVPRPGELRSRFLLRVAAVSLGMLLLLGGTMVAGAIALRGQMDRGNPWVLGVVCFGLPLFCGVSALSALCTTIEALFLRLTGRDREFGVAEDARG